MLDVKSITEKSVLRSEAADGFDHPIGAWNVFEWSGAVAGEAGEALNVAKKMSRFDHKFGSAARLAGGDRDMLKRKLVKEMADVFLYLVLLAHSEGIDLEAAIVERFNGKCDEIGYSGPRIEQRRVEYVGTDKWR